VALIYVGNGHFLPGKVLEQRGAELIERPLQREQQGHRPIGGGICQRRHALILRGALLRHDVFHDGVPLEALAHEDRLVGRAGAARISKRKGQHVSAAKRFDLGGEFFQNQRFAQFRRHGGQTGSQRIGAFLTEQRIHMPRDALVSDPCIDTVIVEEENAIAAPVLDYPLYDFQRQSLVPKRIDE
jgi:hypothetical protein